MDNAITNMGLYFTYLCMIDYHTFPDATDAV